jgi:hypothetical protein
MIILKAETVWKMIAFSVHGHRGNLNSPSARIPG